MLPLVGKTPLTPGGVEAVVAAAGRQLLAVLRVRILLARTHSLLLLGRTGECIAGAEEAVQALLRVRAAGAALSFAVPPLSLATAAALAGAAPATRCCSQTSSPPPRRTCCSRVRTLLLARAYLAAASSSPAAAAAAGVLGKERQARYHAALMQAVMRDPGSAPVAAAEENEGKGPAAQQLELFPTVDVGADAGGGADDDDDVPAFLQQLAAACGFGGPTRTRHAHAGWGHCRSVCTGQTPNSRRQASWGLSLLMVVDSSSTAPLKSWGRAAAHPVPLGCSSRKLHCVLVLWKHVSATTQFLYVSSGPGV